MKLKRLLSSILVLALLVGCQGVKNTVQKQTETDAATMNSFDDSYYKMIDLGSSELRDSFYTDFGNTSDFKNIGRGLQVLSTKYFDTSKYYMSEGQYLKRDQKDQLLKRDDKGTYKYTLQPAKEESIEGIKGPVMVQNIQEQDYYIKSGNSYELRGLSIAVIIDPTGGQEGTTLSDKTIGNYGKQCIEKLYKYIREAKEFEKIRDLPILIAVYRETNAATSMNDGCYILKSYCQKGLGDIQTVSYKTVIFSSTEANNIDKTTASEFDVIKSNLKDASTEAAGLVGIAQYMNNEIQSMKIEANLNVKTYTELLYLTSLIADNIDTRFSSDFNINVLVKSQDQLEAIIVKEKGSNAKTTILE